MSEQAQITSIAALESFRAALVVYLAQMRPALEEISGEVQHTRAWMEDDRRRHWQQELRRRTQRLEDAKQELFTATLSKLGEAKSFQQLAVQRAQRELRVAEDKFVILKKWDRELDHRTAPLVKQMEQLHGFLTVEMERAVVYLDQVIRTLDAYQKVAPPPAQPSGGTP
jgi:chromosome segregation ATPase